MVSSFTPRYFEIEQVLRARIEGLSTGDPVPSDAELSSEFGVSRMTVRQAFQALVNEGLVVRRPGMGTFVADKSPHRQASLLVGFSAEMRGKGLTPSSKILESRIRQPSPEEREVLQLVGTDDVVSLTRIRLADDLPVAIERAVLRPGCAGVLDSNLERGSLHTALRTHGIVLASGRATIFVDRASATEAEILGVEAGEPLLVERRIIFDTDAVPTEFTESRYAMGRYELESDFVVDLG